MTDLPPENLEPKPQSRRMSGFASAEYWTPERRQAQRERVKRMHEEGRFGGKQLGAGRPRKKTVAEYVAEEFAKKGELVYRELLSMLQHKSPQVKLGAIDRINKMEADVQKNMRDDEKEIAKLGSKELYDALMNELSAYGATIDIPDEDIEDLDEEILGEIEEAA
jgi:hypothetical protein